MGGENNQGLIPFGKYRGQPIEVLLADQGYLQWLLAQAWFAQQYAQLHTLVLNRGVVPDETPEHNALQLLFLEEGACLQACRAWEAFAPKHDRYHTGKSGESYLSYGHAQIVGQASAVFEQRGIDVTISYHVAALWTEETQDVYEHWEPRQAEYVPYLRSHSVEERAAGQDALNTQWKATRVWVPNHYQRESVWEKQSAQLTIELKPSLGDDYPAVLRKMLGGAGMMLVYEDWHSQMPVSQVERLFARSGKLLIGLDTLRTYPAHINSMPTEPPAEG